MTQPDFRIFDADNHYYEAEDALTRHLDKKMRKRVAEWVELNGRRRLLIGGVLNSFIPNPTFDPIGKPGALMDYYLGSEDGGKTFLDRIRDVEPLSDRPEYPGPRRSPRANWTSSRWMAAGCSRPWESASSMRWMMTSTPAWQHSLPSIDGSMTTGDSPIRIASSPRPTSAYAMSPMPLVSSSGSSGGARG